METKIGVILAAGMGERLDIQNRIKPLVYIGNKPLIVWNIDRMQEIGLTHIYIAVGHKGELIKKEILANPLITANIDFIETPNWQDGMFASILNIKNNIKEPFFMSPCDLFFEKNPYEFFTNEDIQFEGISSLIYLLEEQEDITGATSRISIGENNSLSYVKSPIISEGVETGIYHFGKDVVSIIQEYDTINTFPQLLEYLYKKGLLRLRYFANEKWFDVNTPAVKIRAEMFLRKQYSYKSNKYSIEKYPMKIAPFTTFITKKEVETEIHLKRNCVMEIDSFQMIPEAHADSPHFLITDENVDRLFGKHVYGKLKSSGYKINKIVLPSGENNKTLDNYISLSERVLSEGIDERTILISLGGGTINNITGFLAATLYRGISLIHIPTTLMAQCDAAIGIKQAVNGEKGKNLIGSYYEPLKIIVDPSVLLTSDDRGLKDGLSECIKHAIAQDSSFYTYLMDYQGDIKNIDFLEYVVKKNIELKIEVMKNDPKEHTKALVLQYGHTVGHAVEYLSGYKLGHGEAVSIGMVAAANISKILDVADNGLVGAHCDMLQKFGLPIAINKSIKPEDIIMALRYNKRYLYGDIQFVLLDKIGSLWEYENDYSIPCDNELITGALLACYEV